MYKYCTLVSEKNQAPSTAGTLDFWQWGLRARSHDIRQYEAGKRKLSALDLTPDEYYRSIQLLSNWLVV
jgi:hypothetical protein